MSATIIDGKQVAAKVRQELKARVAALTAKRGRAPGLSVLLVGDDPGSAIYVRNKEKAAAEVGMRGDIVRLPASATEAQVLAAVDALNADKSVDGFIVQMPLPKGIDTRRVLMRVAPEKDADGLHPASLGKLACGIPGPVSCTPQGCMRLLDEAGVKLDGLHAVVVGRSEIVGKPMALLLLQRNATVTICHSKTQNLAEEIRRADVVVAAVGRPGLITGEMLKPSCVVIDVGINRVSVAGKDKVVGDVEFDSASKKARAITPVPGGVGPMTVAMLLKNTCDLAELHSA